MKRLNLTTQANPHFIGNWNIENNSLCKEMINFFEENPDLHIKGKISGGIDEEVKKTVDITINPKDLENDKFKVFNEYFKNLYECFGDYKEQYPFLKTFVKKIHIGPFNIQKYLKGDHFGTSHSERTDISTIHRLFAWMTYLNDVDDGAEWTHVHKGSILKSGKKYIITGWLHFTD